MNFKNRKFRESLAILLVLSLGIGFALISSGLNINIGATLASNSWDVYFDNVQVSEGSVAAFTPTITNNTTVDYSVEFEKPGDFYEFTVDAINEGTIDAKISSVLKTNIDSDTYKFVNYTLTYNDDIPLEENDVLEANTTEKIKVRVEYSRDIEENDLLLTDVSLNLSFSVDYVKSDIKVTPSIEVGKTYTFGYIKDEKEFQVPENGIYKLEVWGAEGGKNQDIGYIESAAGGYGGYSVGEVVLKKNEILYINVGGQGANGGYKNWTAAAGGYNGGGNGGVGNGGSYDAGSGGGGATHIATSSGLLKDLEEDKNSVLIVAGGGGGGGQTLWYIPGSGGGVAGVNSNYGSGYPTAVGGKQDSGYKFGQGQNGRYASTFASNGAEGNGGAGGGWYGGSTPQNTGYQTNCGGSGGSGYIGNERLFNKYMYCLKCTTSNEISTKTYTTSSHNITAYANVAKQGNGYAKITYLGKIKTSTFFANFQKAASSVDVGNFNIDNDKGKVSFTTSLSNTEGFMEYQLSIINSSKKDMYISHWIKSEYDSSKVRYSITYAEDGIEVSERDIIHANSSENIIVRVQLLEENVELTEENFSFQMKLNKKTE